MKTYLYIAFAILMTAILPYQKVVCQEPDSPFSFESDINGDFVSVLSGGIKTCEPEYMGLISFQLGFDFEKAGLWKGGSFLIHIHNTHGQTVSADNVGDLQVFSNLEAGNHTGIFELIYTQKIGNLEISTGWNDLNATFSCTEFGGFFINSSFGITPGISLNVPVSIFPTTSPFVQTSYAFTKNSTLSFATYAGNPGDIENNRYNVKWDINQDNGMLSILQYAHSGSGEKKYCLKTGVYEHTGNFRAIKDTNKVFEDNYGIYLNFDKQLTLPGNRYSEGLNAFFQFSWAPSDRNLVNYYLGGGLTCHGFMRNKDARDKAGLGIAHLATSKTWQRTNPGCKASETALELTYQILIKERISFQPDIQYILNPGAGSNGNLQNALISGIRFTLIY